MIYLDVNIFLYPVLYEDDGLARKCKEILLKVAKGEIKAFTSFLSWDEFVWVVSRTLGKEIALESGRKFISFPNLRWIEVDGTIIFEAQRIMERFGLSPRDSIHVASALKYCEEIITTDKDFEKAGEVVEVTVLE